MTTTDTTPQLTEAQLLEQMKAAFEKSDFGAVKRLAAELDKLAKAEAATKKAEIQKHLEELGILVKHLLGAVVNMMVAGQPPEARQKDRSDAVSKLADELYKLTGKELDGAEGVWYAQDFGATLVDIRLVKAAKKAATAGTGDAAGKGSYVADPRKSADMLKDVGSNVMFAEETKVTIDKVEQTMQAGMTLQQAYDFSQNGGWRNRVRMALLKEHDKFLASH